jgi:chaperonin cofactor prefoldin
MSEKDQVIDQLQKLEARRKQQYEDAVKEITRALNAAEKAHKDWMEAHQALTEALVGKEAEARKEDS